MDWCHLKEFIMSELTKAEAIQNRNAKNQEAIVKLTIPQNYKPRNYIVPGGQRIRESLDTVEKLTDALHNWMRSEQIFTSFVFSFSSSTDLSSYKKVRAETFPSPVNGMPLWQSSQDRKMGLAITTAKVIQRYKNLVSLEVTPAGIDVYLDTANQFSEASADWEPNYSVTPSAASKGQYSIRP